MKNHVSALALLLPLALASAGSAFAADAETTCSLATLRGTYLFSAEGTTVAGKGKGPNAIAGYEVYDGKGGTRNVQTFSINGKITRAVRATGTYTLSADCIAAVAYSDGTHFDQFVAPDGSVFTFVQTDAGTVESGVETRVTAKRVGG